MSAPAIMHLQYMGAVPGYVLGSVAEGGSTITLASADHSFKAGSKLIMEIGGEAGLGARGTIGVGGTWPALLFDTEAELLASTDPDDPGEGFPVAGALDTGNLWIWDNDPPEAAHWEQPHESSRSFLKFLPRALEATVVSVSGATLTINTTATVASSNAKVWYDNTEVFKLALYLNAGAVRVPADEQPYAIRGELSTFGVANDNAEVYGDSATGSAFYQPKGCAALVIKLYDAPDVTVRDLGFERGWTEDACWNGKPGYVVSLPHTVSGISALRTSILRCRFVNGVWGDVVLSQCTDGEIRGCDIEHTVPAYHYVSWSAQLADCTGCSIVDCSYDGDYIHEAFEIFKGTNCSIENFTTRNGVGANNSSANSQFSGIDVTLDAQLLPARDALDPFRPNAVLNWNNNFSLSTAEGGALTDSEITIESDPGGLITGVFARHSALPAAGDPITMSSVTITTNGNVHAVGAISLGDAVQDLDIDGLTTDGRVDLHYGSIANSTIHDLRYCGDNVTLGSGNNITSQTDTCA